MRNDSPPRAKNITLKCMDDYTLSGKCSSGLEAELFEEILSTTSLLLALA